MADDSVLLGHLAEQFAARVRKGELPQIEEYAEGNPALADRIRALFPTLMLLEGMAAGGGETSSIANVSGLPPGSAFGAYRIESMLGQGGMGVVYEAVHLALDRRVALKVLPVDGPRTASQLERFLREARTAAGLHHTNIVPVFDVGQVGGTPYYAMQLIRGVGLDHMDRDGAPADDPDRTVDAPSALPRSVPARAEGPPARPDHYRWVADIGVQVAEALAYAHERGVIHRDIKPSNLLLDDRGVVWITDFGLARRPEDVALTHTGAILGTPRYMSPEQAEAAKRPIDHRTDIYSLGATLYELATRRPAFDGKTPFDVVMQVIGREPVPPHRLDRNVPADLETIILKAMAKRPDERYPTAQALADDLRRFLKLEPIQAQRTGPIGRIVRWTRRNPKDAVMVEGFILATVAIAVLALGMWYNAKQWDVTTNDLNQTRTDLAEVELRVTEREAAVAQLEGKITVEQQRLARVQEHLGDGDARLRYEQARALRAMPVPDRRRRILELLAKAETLRRRPHQFTPQRDERPVALPTRQELRSEAVAAIVAPDARVIRAVRTPIGISAVITPDGRTVATSWYDSVPGRLVVERRDVMAGKEYPPIRVPGIALSFALNRDGRQVAVGTGHRPPVPWRVQLWDGAAKQPVRTLDAPGDATPVGALQLKPSFSPDGRHLVAISPGVDAQFVLWDLDTGAGKLLHRCPATVEAWAAFNPDGTRLALARDKEYAWIWTLPGDKKPQSVQLPLPLRRGAQPVLGKRTLVVGCQTLGGEPCVLGWDVEANRERFRLTSAAPQQELFALSADERLLAVSDGTNGFTVFDLDGEHRPQRIEVHQDTIAALGWQADTGRIVSVGLDGVAHVTELLRDVPQSTPVTGLHADDHAAFSPDRQWLAINVRSQHQIRLVHRAGKQPERRLIGSGLLHFPPDSSQVLVVRSDEINAWDLPGAAPAAPSRIFSPIVSLAFRADGALWAACATDTTQRVWDITAQREVFRLPESYELLADCLSADGRWLASWDWESVNKRGARYVGHVWELPAGRKVGRFELHDAERTTQRAVISGDGRWLALGYLRTNRSAEPTQDAIAVFTLPDGKLHLDIAATGLAGAPALSADGKLLALACRDGTVRVWDLPQREELFRWTPAATEPLHQLLFTPEGSLAAHQGSALRLLDLPRLRQQLDAIGLGW